MYNTHVEQNLRRIRNTIEFLQCLLELIVVVSAQGRDPRFYFLDKELALHIQNYYNSLLKLINLPASKTLCR